jgi:hypothetical protein
LRASSAPAHRPPVKGREPNMNTIGLPRAFVSSNTSPEKRRFFYFFLNFTDMFTVLLKKFLNFLTICFCLIV